MADRWSPWREWCMDVLKTLLTFAMAAAASLLIIDRLEEQRAELRYFSQVGFQTRLSALDDFRTSSLRYKRAAYAAFTDLSEWNGSLEKTPGMRHYELQAYQEFQIGIEGLRFRFGKYSDINQLVDQFEKSNDRRHHIYRLLREYRAKNKTWPAGEPMRSRAEFDKHFETFDGIRNSIIAQLETSIASDMPVQALSSGRNAWMAALAAPAPTSTQRPVR